MALRTLIEIDYTIFDLDLDRSLINLSITISKKWSKDQMDQESAIDRWKSVVIRPLGAAVV